MMWFIPGAIAVIGLVPILVAASRAAKEAADVRREILRFSELRPALLELRSNASTVRTAAVTTYRNRLPGR